MPIKCTFYLPNSNPESAIIAQVGFHIEEWDLYLSKCKLVKSRNGHQFIAVASEPYTDNKTGEQRYSKFFWFGKSMQDRFQEGALKAIAEYLKEKPVMQHTASIKESEPADYSEDDLPF